MQNYAPQLPPPGDLTINKMQVSVAPRQSYSMLMKMADDTNPWVIPIGPKNLNVSNVFMSFKYLNGGSVTGSVGGTLTLDNIGKLAIRYDIPGNIMIRSSIPLIQLRQLMATLTNEQLPIPDGFDLRLTNSSVLIQKQADNYVFQLATNVDGFGMLALQVQKNAATWGIAFGLDMSAGLPSGLPGLGFLSKFEQIFPLSKLMVVASTFNAAGFSFPDTAGFNNPALNTKALQLTAQGNTLVAGLNIFAQWQINTSDQKQNLLKKFPWY